MDTQQTLLVADYPTQTGIILDGEKIELLRRTIARGASEDELALFVEQCRRTGLDPFARQIYSVRRKQWNSLSRQYEEQQVIQVSIDGFRLIADRTHKYAGQVGPWWCGPDGEWKEVWLSDEAPAAARVGVMRHEFNQPLYATALFKSYVQTNAHGEPVNRWKNDPAGMLAKCAEALALRRAFPHELSGLYTTEEMLQADTPAHVDASGKPDRSSGQRPFTMADLRTNFNRAVNTIESRGMVLGADDFDIVSSTLANLLPDPEQATRFVQWLTGATALGEMNEAEIIALQRLLKPTFEDDAWQPCAEARIEAETILAALQENQESMDEQPAQDE